MSKTRKTLGLTAACLAVAAFGVFGPASVTHRYEDGFIGTQQAQAGPDCIQQTMASPNCDIKTGPAAHQVRLAAVTAWARPAGPCWEWNGPGCPAGDQALTAAA